MPTRRQADRKSGVSVFPSQLRTGDRLTKTLYTGTFKTDPHEETRAHRLHPDRGQDKGKTWRGIYLLEGDTLRTNDNAPDVSKPRPTQFTTTPASGHVLVVFKRS